MRTIAGAFLFVGAFVSTAPAQELTTALSVSAGSNGPYSSAEFRASLPTSEKFAVEPFVTLGSKQHPAQGVEGFWGVQIRQRIAKLTTRDSYVFATYGLSAYYSNFGSEAPVIGQFGFGVRHRTSKYLALRSEFDLLTWMYYPATARFTLGVSVRKP
jgi:hypothetical protein